MPKITKIESAIPIVRERKKVAAYARVSMQSERMLHSLSAQVSFYSGLIQKNPDWEYVGVYADDFISGTKTAGRDEFKQMLEDCEAGKIDIILTKSISRFARNTVDLLETVRRLKELGIEIRFEKEHINSLDGDGELMLTILASFAQEESRSISENCKWGIRKRFEQGIPNGHFQIYGYRWEGETLVPVPEEAAIVKRIFQNFLDGKSRLETEKEFAAEGITTREGCRWVDSNIKKILTNVTYTGNMLFQKEFISDPIEKKRKKNRGELPQYFVEDTHEALIDKETFDYVQEEIARRKELGCFANKSLDGMLTCFSTKIKCGQCGRSFVRSTRRNRAKISRLGAKYTFWVCTSRKKTNCPTCSTGIIREDVLKEECAKVLGTDEFDDDVFSEKVEQVVIPGAGTMVFKFKDSSELEHHWYRNFKKDSWTDECRARASEYRRSHAATRDDITCFTTKIKCVSCGCNFRSNEQKCVSVEGGKMRYWRCAAHDGCGTVGLRDDLLRSMAAEVLGMGDFDEDVFREKIDRIEVLSASEVFFCFKDGKRVSREWVKPKRKMPPWTPERREKQTAAIRASFTPERRKKMSETMKRVRSEKHWASKRK